ncbi:hypothetical protein D5018_19400 [Parashewanella curva]|uniref:Uncharacterized protein n=1 Tax=Parashewanella curva TaxID=2338552 RepID=A0A3L8PRM5_9GAMM|nr:FlhC family transcriptional regulator [Parashewanella curva]RLV58035.1 hypothetical protein D5018_19400 [Parashewanella curva]
MNAIQRSQKTLKAFRLLKAGFKTSIIVNDTGLKPDYIRSLTKELENVQLKGGQLPEAKAILNTHFASIEGYAFLSTYLTLTTKQTSNHLDLDVLARAYQLYIKIRNQCELCKSSNTSAIDINEAWVLLRSFKINNIVFHRCRHCYNHFIIPADKQPNATCPFCYLKRKVS